MTNNYTSGEKIRLARQYLGLKQSDIVGGEITRNLISAVENNKVPLSKKTAVIVVRNINKLAADMNKDYTIDLDYLFMDTNDYNASKEANYLIARLNKILDHNTDYNYQTDIWAKEILIALKDTTLRLEIYFLLGKIAKMNDHLSKQYHYFKEGFNLAFISDNEEYVVKCNEALLLCCKALEYYDEIVSFNKVIAEKFESPSKDLLLKSYYHMADAFISMAYYDKAIENLEQSNTYIEDSHSVASLNNMILLGKAHHLKDNTEISIDYYNTVVKIAKNNALSEIEEVAITELSKLS